MQKLCKASIAIVLALLMVIPLATQASARQIPLPNPRRSDGLPGNTASVGGATIGGTNFTSAIQYSVSANRLIRGSAFTDHHLGGQQATLSAYVGRVSGRGNATIAFYSVNSLGIGRLIQSHTIRLSSPQRVYVDVRGVETLRIRVTKAENNSLISVSGTYALAQAQLCNDMEAAAARFRQTPWGWIFSIGGLVIAAIGLLLALVFMGSTDSPWTPGYLIALGGGVLVLLGVTRLLGIDISFG